MEPVTATSERVDDTPAIEILLVDEQLILCEGLRKLIEAEPGFTVVGATCDPDEAVRLVEDCRPDIVIVSLTGRPLVRLLQMLQELTTAGSSLQHVICCGVFLVDMKEFPKMNEVYARAFGAHRPARTTVEVSGLPGEGLLVEIDAVAYIP